MLGTLRETKLYQRLTKREIVAQFVKYASVGVVNVVIFFTIFNVLRVADVGTTIARAVAFFLSSLFSFRMNKQWAFRDPRRHAVLRQYLGFVVLTLIGFGLQSLAFKVFLIPLDDGELLHENIALAGSLPISVLWNFSFYRYWVFRKGGSAGPGSAAV